MPLLSLPVVSVRQETPRALVIHLDLGGRPFPFDAGQYVLLGQRRAHERRPYSLASAPVQVARFGRLEFLIQVGPDGTPGPHLPSLEEGAWIDVEGPEGEFTLPTGRSAADVLLVAGGTGIAPLRSMLWQLLETVSHARIGLVQSGRTPDELAYAAEFRALSKAGRVQLVETVTREAPASWQGIRGRIDRAQLEAAITGPHPLCFVCGPDSLVQDVPHLLHDLGVPASQVYTEQWAETPTRDHVLP